VSINSRAPEPFFFTITKERWGASAIPNCLGQVLRAITKSSQG
jgi:hypothetical protein